MQWDRLAMVTLGFFSALYTGYQGWRDLRKGRYLAAAGAALAALTGLLVPALLAALVD